MLKLWVVRPYNPRLLVERRRKRRPRSKTKETSESANQSTASELPDMAYMAKQFLPTFGKDEWLVDSGTTCHIVMQHEMFQDFMPGTTSMSGFGKGMNIESHGKGTVILNSTVNGKFVPVTLKDIIYSPTALNCLLSIQHINTARGSTSFAKGNVSIKGHNGNIILGGKVQNRIYLLNAKATTSGQTREWVNFAAHKCALTWDEWHRALRHLSISSIEKFVKLDIVMGLNIDPDSKPSLSCKACIKGKALHNCFWKETNEGGHRPGDLTYSDLWGPA
jgi:hypothetical protein